ncbi:SDR family oxidoreductase [Mucilaginibacter glaciei]|uniref:SDR family oxidoreductase n=1 Tax=Mucilaginibacter glaciei TaxID=2772109 RepID=UPI0021D20929|nr:SDR family oxidoreductase [Mucilaginibacter glaciei]
MKSLAKDQGKPCEEMQKEFFANMRGTSIIKRFLTPEEIANMVTYIASPLSAATNGATLRADGGLIKTAF